MCHCYAVREQCGARKLVEYNSITHIANVYHIGHHRCHKKLDFQMRCRNSQARTQEFAQMGGSASLAYPWYEASPYLCYRLGIYFSTVLHYLNKFYAKLNIQIYRSRQLTFHTNTTAHKCSLWFVAQLLVVESSYLLLKGYCKCKVQPRYALLGYPFCNTAAHM